MERNANGFDCTAAQPHRQCKNTGAPAIQVLACQLVLCQQAGILLRSEYAVNKVTQSEAALTACPILSFMAEAAEHQARPCSHE